MKRSVIIASHGDRGGVPIYIKNSISSLSGSKVLFFLTAGSVSGELKAKYEVYTLSEQPLWFWLFFLRTVLQSDIILCHSFLASIVARLFSLFTRVPCIYFVNGWSWRGKRSIVKYILLFIEKKLSYITTNFIFVSTEVQRMAPDIIKKKGKLIKTGIPNIVANLDEKHDGQLIVAMFARVCEAKDHSTLAEAISKLDAEINIAVKFFGAGTNGLQFMKQMNILAGSNSHLLSFYGEVTDVVSEIENANIIILSSVYEALPLTILEGFRQKRCVLASDFEGVKDIILCGKNGLLFKKRDHNELAKKIILLAKRPELREQIAECGYQTWRQFYSIDRYCIELNDRIEEILEVKN